MIVDQSDKATGAGVVEKGVIKQIFIFFIAQDNWTRVVSE